MRARSDWGWLRRFAGFVAPHRRTLYVTMAAALVVTAMNAVMPLALRSAFDRATGESDAPLWTSLAMILAVGVIRMLAHFYRRSRVFSLVWAVEFDLRNAIFDRLQRLDFARHDQLDTGQMVSRSNADLALLTNVITWTPMTAGNVVLFVVSLGVMVVLSPLMASVLAVTMPALAILSARMSKRVFASSWDMLQWQAEVAGVVEESVSGVRVVKGFGQEQRQLDRLAEASTSLFRSRMRNARIQAFYAPLLNHIPLLGQLVTLVAGGYLVIEGRLTLGTFVAFQAYLTQLQWPARDVANVILQLQQARAGAERIFEILDAEPVVREQDRAADPPDGPVRLELVDVTFGYQPADPVLRGLTLTVEPGERVALVGGSGSGKTTVALLLPRFYDVQAGAVLIGGSDVRAVRLDALRRRFGVVFEESFLFSETIRANIAYGHPDATDAQVEAAARAAAADEFIRAMPHGYETLVGERGLSLSGGQRQRIALARALVTDPEVLLLDDATSSIDVRVEEEIHQTLRRVAEGRTMILVAHRRSTLSLATRIVVLDDGRVADDGTHEELLERCASYRRLLGGDAPDAVAPVVALPTPTAWPDVQEVDAVAGMAFVADDELDEDLLAGLAGLPPVTDSPAVDVDREATTVEPFRMWRFVRPYRWALAGALALVLVDAALAVAAPAVVRVAVDKGIETGDPGALVRASLVFLALLVAALFTQRWLVIAASRAAQRILLALRVRVFAQLQRLGIDFYDREMAGRIMTHATSDIETLQLLFQQGMLGALAAVAMFVGAAAVLVAMSPQLATATLTVVLPLVLLTRWFERRANPAFLAAREQLAAVNASYQESLSGVRVAQAFVREERNMVEFRRATSELRAARNRAEWLGAVYVPGVDLLSTIAIVIILGYGARLHESGTITDGLLVAFVLYLNQVFSPVQQLSQTFSTYQQARVAMGKIRELFATAITVPAPVDGVDPGRVSGRTALDAVRFSYAGADAHALDGVSIDIPAGQTVALVGETGAGKSTVMKLVARFYDPDDGRVLCDGVPLSALDPTGYRRNIGYVPQEAHLFTGSVRDNIAFARPGATDAEVERAARAVGAHDFITRMPLGYRSRVRDGGRSMSAGQRQLVALARALLVDPVVLLLDEATANLDLATEGRVAKAMGMVSEGRTTILIAHRLRTAARADRIVVVDNGKIVEDGTHDDLVASGGHYAELWHAWEEPDPDDPTLASVGSAH